MDIGALVEGTAGHSVRRPGLTGLAAAAAGAIAVSAAAWYNAQQFLEATLETTGRAPEMAVIADTAIRNLSNIAMMALAAAAGLGVYAISYAGHRMASSVRDPILGVYSRTSHDMHLPQFYREAKKGSPSAYILGDVNNMKETNDRLGHREGDVLLRILGLSMETSIRQPSNGENGERDDRAYRYGGDEVALMLKSTGISGAAVVMQKISDAFIGNARRRYGNERFAAGHGIQAVLVPDIKWEVEYTNRVALVVPKVSGWELLQFQAGQEQQPGSLSATGLLVIPSISWGVAMTDKARSSERLVETADAFMYENKARYKEALSSKLNELGIVTPANQQPIAR